MTASKANHRMSKRWPVTWMIAAAIASTRIAEQAFSIAHCQIGNRPSHSRTAPKDGIPGRPASGLLRRFAANRPTRTRGLEPLAFWMQTTGAALLAVEQRSLLCMWLPAQDGRSAHRLLYPLLYGTTRARRNTGNPVLTSDYQLGNWTVTPH